MAPHRHQLPGQRRADDERQRAPQPHPPVVHADLLLPGAGQRVGQRHQRREEQVETRYHQHQPAPAVAEAKADREGQGQQRQQAQGGD